MIADFFYYALYTSAVLIYGIGINRATIISEKPENYALLFVKMLITVISSAVLTYIIDLYLLIPVHLTELFPFVSVLIFSGVSVFIESIIRITSKTNAAELAVSLLTVILAVNESISLEQCVIISCFCTLSFYIFVPFLYAIQKRIEITRPATDFRNSSLLIISIALIILSLVAWNVSWLNPGVFQ